MFLHRYFLTHVVAWGDIELALTTFLEYLSSLMLLVLDCKCSFIKSLILATVQCNNKLISKIYLAGAMGGAYFAILECACFSSSDIFCKGKAICG